MSQSAINPVVVLEGSPLGTPTSRTFATVEDAESYVLERVRAQVNPSLKQRAETAIADRIVSEDGLKAVAEVLTSKLDFLRALTKAYAPKITISVRAVEEREDD
ncbi:MAG: hypothetical protein EAZ30_11275 [Betaproteobacteria bacterium]|nr:MAG: hypothetical protein EAZ30_11275 [Betaproteobacteria bacterium]